MSLILNIDTASYNCSVALSDDDNIITYEESDSGNHTRVLLPVIQRALKNAGKEIHNLSAIAVNIGPGSYTGLRIGLATAKGLCYSVGLTLIPVNGLTAMAHYAIKHNRGKHGYYVIVQDNYRGGWYYAIYDERLNGISPPGSCNKIYDILLTLPNRPIFVFGDMYKDNNNILTVGDIFWMPYTSQTANHLAPIASSIIGIDCKFDLISTQPLYINSVF